MASRQPANAVSGRTCRVVGGQPERRGEDATSIAMRTGARNSPNAAEGPEQQRVLEHRRDHRREERLGDGVERPVSARARASTRPARQLERRRREDEERRRERDGELAKDAAQGLAGIEPELLGCLEHGQPERGMPTSPTTPTRSRAIASRSRSCRPSTAAMVREGIGAGDGIRTRDIQIGKLALYQLSYSRSAADADLR